MCDNVIIHYLNGTERTCETQFELHQAMVNGIVLEDPFPYLRYKGETIAQNTNWLLNYGFCWEGCLCPIDLEETAKRNGYIYSKKDRSLEGTEFEYDPFDTHFYEGKDTPKQVID